MTSENTFIGWGFPMIKSAVEKKEVPRGLQFNPDKVLSIDQIFSQLAPKPDTSNQSNLVLVKRAPASAQPPTSRSEQPATRKQSRGSQKKKK